MKDLGGLKQNTKKKKKEEGWEEREIIPIWLILNMIEDNL